LLCGREAVTFFLFRLMGEILIGPQAWILLDKCCQSTFGDLAKHRIDLIADSTAYLVGLLVGCAGSLIIDVSGGENSEINIEPPSAIF